MKKIIAALLLSAILLPVMGQNQSDIIYRFGDRYVCNGINMDEKAYAGFLKNNSPEAFAKFNDGQKLATAGWVLFGSGLAMQTVGTAIMVLRAADISNRIYEAERIDLYDLGFTEEELRAEVDEEYGTWNENSHYWWNAVGGVKKILNKCQKDDKFVAGEVINTIGSAATTASIPLLIVGYIRKHDSANLYNMHQPGNSPYVTLNAVNSGLGMGLHF